MRKIVIIPGGFHPFHAGHKSLYDAAQLSFPGAEVYVAATADTSSRPFPFELKKKLARLAGVPAHRFIQVKSPFQATEITQHFDPENTVLIFARSEKDRDQPPMPGKNKKDGSPGYLQPIKKRSLEPMSRHGYMAYLPVVQFGSGMTSATEIRAKWPAMDPEQKAALVNGMYPVTQTNKKLTDVVVSMFDSVLSAPEVKEATLINDPEQGIEIRPDGGFGTWNESTLVSSLARQLSDLAENIKNKNYRNVEYLLYKGGAIESKVRSLSRLQDFMEKQGRRPIAKNKEIDIGEQSDYVDEKTSHV
jgi:hypothetical protein